MNTAMLYGIVLIMLVDVQACNQRKAVPEPASQSQPQVALNQPPIVAPTNSLSGSTTKGPRIINGNGGKVSSVGRACVASGLTVIHIHRFHRGQ